MYTSISGFIEYTPAEQIQYNFMKDIIREEFERVGAINVSTVAVEKVETLMNKGSDNKEIYQITRMADTTDVKPWALRFDLTVPYARYVLEHERELPFPFTRYEIAPVWRGESASGELGRQRQFDQCDVDICNKGELSLLNDALMPSIIYRIFRRLQVGKFVISINNRKILTGFLSSLGVSETEISTVIKIVDNKDKSTHEETKRALAEYSIDTKGFEQIEFFFGMCKDATPDEVLAKLASMDGTQQFFTGVAELVEVVGYLRSLGVPDAYFSIDTSIARGLDYYTGTVYETRLTEHPKVGSVCSGGRYDNLLEKLGAKEHMPGVGISIGLSRLFASLLKNQVITAERSAIVNVMVSTLDNKRINDYLQIAANLRGAGINTELYSEPHKLGKQLKYANRKRIPFVIIAGETELLESNVIIRDLEQGEEQVVPIKDLCSKVISLTLR